jgi:hypothetical protein
MGGKQFESVAKQLERGGK